MYFVSGDSTPQVVWGTQMAEEKVIAFCDEHLLVLYNVDRDSTEQN